MNLQKDWEDYKKFIFSHMPVNIQDILKKLYSKCFITGYIAGVLFGVVTTSMAFKVFLVD